MTHAEQHAKLVEKVAEALFKNDGRQRGYRWFGIAGEIKNMFRDDAKCAIAVIVEALEDVTPEMIGAAKPLYPMHRDKLREDWLAMLRASPLHEKD